MTLQAGAHPQDDDELGLRHHLLYSGCSHRVEQVLGRRIQKSLILLNRPVWDVPAIGGREALQEIFWRGHGPAIKEVHLLTPRSWWLPACDSGICVPDRGGCQSNICMRARQLAGLLGGAKSMEWLRLCPMSASRQRQRQHSLPELHVGAHVAVLCTNKGRVGIEGVE